MKPRPPLATAARAVLPHPELWATGVVQLLRLATPGWWRRWPPVPRPDAAWLAFRMETQYGSPHATPDREDVLAWLRWCRELARTGAKVHRGRERLR